MSTWKILALRVKRGRSLNICANYIVIQWAFLVSYIYRYSLDNSISFPYGNRQLAREKISSSERRVKLFGRLHLFHYLNHFLGILTAVRRGESLLCVSFTFERVFLWFQVVIIHDFANVFEPWQNCKSRLLILLGKEGPEPILRIENQWLLSKMKYLIKTTLTKISWETNLLTWSWLVDRMWNRREDGGCWIILRFHHWS